MILIYLFSLQVPAPTSHTAPPRKWIRSDASQPTTSTVQPQLHQPPHSPTAIEELPSVPSVSASEIAVLPSLPSVSTSDIDMVNLMFITPQASPFQTVNVNLDSIADGPMPPLVRSASALSGNIDVLRQEEEIEQYIQELRDANAHHGAVDESQNDVAPQDCNGDNDVAPQDPEGDDLLLQRLLDIERTTTLAAEKGSQVANFYQSLNASINALTDEFKKCEEARRRDFKMSEEARRLDHRLLRDSLKAVTDQMAYSGLHLAMAVEAHTKAFVSLLKPSDGPSDAPREKSPTSSREQSPAATPDEEGSPTIINLESPSTAQQSPPPTTSPSPTTEPLTIHDSPSPPAITSQSPTTEPLTIHDSPNPPPASNTETFTMHDCQTSATANTTTAIHVSPASAPPNTATPMRTFQASSPPNTAISKSASPVNSPPNTATPMHTSQASAPQNTTESLPVSTARFYQASSQATSTSIVLSPDQSRAPGTRTRVRTRGGVLARGRGTGKGGGRRRK